MTHPIAPGGKTLPSVPRESQRQALTQRLDTIGNLAPDEVHPDQAPSGFDAALRDVKMLSTPAPSARRMPVIDKTQVDPQLLKAAQGMETMFIELMMKEMRKTVQKNPLDGENHASEIYRGMLDHEVSEKAARTGGVGIADQIIAYIQASGYTGKGR